ncbi:elongation factor P [Candidatus Curtissbacteria bacterium RBG_13_35_7]|uniref:Elongation factor P n=1 Tax=Candidatus Curtissbacteria bacterium RBG_13_35_7 TaxID=1797705 RepID=A0A1F5G2R7_9BACT|nr:MAG: elongation factor P [Candidatus Curtissbacteria bacterium RBG_13_35_7]
MINVTELRAGTVFQERDDCYLVLSYEHIKIARGSGNIKVKVRNLSTGATIEKSFITGARVQEATLARKKVQYLYSSSQIHVMDLVTYDQYEIDKKMIADNSKYLKDGMEITLVLVNDKPVFVEIPKIIDYKVSQTGGSARGNTVGASYKDAVLENGLVVKVPLFIKTGEIIRVDTRSGEYVERAK